MTLDDTWYQTNCYYCQTNAVMWILTRPNQCPYLAQDYIAHENGTGSADRDRLSFLPICSILDNIDRSRVTPYGAELAGSAR